MKKTYAELLVTIGLACVLFQTPGGSQPSFIAHIMDIRSAVVSVTAENTDLFKSPSAAAIDPTSGHILIAQKFAASSYTRTGAGVIIHPDGLLVTNAHTCDKANIIKVTLYTGETFFAKPVRMIPSMDLIFLEIHASTPLPFVHVGNSDQISLGQEIVTIGHSALAKGTISGGTITGLGASRTLKYSGTHRTDLIQTSINLYKGDSGGPLFNRDGELIGLMTADERSADHSSFAIPSNTIRQYLLEYTHSKNNP